MSVDMANRVQAGSPNSMISNPKSFVGKFAVVTRSKTFIKGEIHEILGVSRSNFFVNIDNVEQIIPIAKYDKPWVDWFSSIREAQANLPIIEERRQAEEGLFDLEDQTDLLANKILDFVDNDPTNSHNETGSGFEKSASADVLRYEVEHLKLAKTFSPEELLAFRALANSKLYQTHRFTRGPHMGVRETVVLSEDAMIASRLEPSIFFDSVNKFVKNDLLVTGMEPETLVNRFFGVKGRIYFQLNVTGLGVLVEISKPNNGFRF